MQSSSRPECPKYPRQVNQNQGMWAIILSVLFTCFIMFFCPDLVGYFGGPGTFKTRRLTLTCAWTPTVGRIIAPKAIILHTFGVQVDYVDPYLKADSSPENGAAQSLVGFLQTPRRIQKVEPPPILASSNYSYPVVCRTLRWIYFWICPGIRVPSSVLVILWLALRACCQRNWYAASSWM